MEKVSIVGLDIVRNSFHAHGAAGDGSKVFSKALPRGRILDFLGQVEPCIIALEACAGAHHWSRELSRLGHDVRLIAPQCVKPYVKRQKNDANDAEAIAEAASRPTMRFVATKTTAQQGQSMVLETCDLLTGQRTQTINALRGHPLTGRAIPKEMSREVGGKWECRSERPSALASAGKAVAEKGERLPADVTNLCQMFFDLIDGLSKRIDDLTRQISRIARQNEVARRLMTMPGVGPVTAVSIAVLAAPPEMFSKGRDLAAWIGLAPRQHSTGGQTRLGKISNPLVTFLSEMHCRAVNGATRFEALAEHRRHVGDSGSAKAWRSAGGLVAGPNAGPQTQNAGCCRTGEQNGADGMGDHGSWRRLRDPCQRLSAKAGWGAVVLNGGHGKASTRSGMGKPVMSRVACTTASRFGPVPRTHHEGPRR